MKAKSRVLVLIGEGVFLSLKRFWLINLIIVLKLKKIIHDLAYKKKLDKICKSGFTGYKEG